MSDAERKVISSRFKKPKHKKKFKKPSWRVTQYLGKTEFARQMRLHPSPPESILWGFLQVRFPRVFHRQSVMVGYIADFYAPRYRLVIEVDGAQHLAPSAVEYDRVRDAAFNKRGFTVVRFPATRVFSECALVLDEIAGYLKSSPDLNPKGSHVGSERDPGRVRATPAEREIPNATARTSR